jgi:hypothetical protein
MYIYVYMYVSIHIHIRMHIHIAYTYTCTYIHTYIHTQALLKQRNVRVVDLKGWRQIDTLVRTYLSNIYTLCDQDRDRDRNRDRDRGLSGYEVSQFDEFIEMCIGIYQIC